MLKSVWNRVLAGIIAVTPVTAPPAVIAGQAAAPVRADTARLDAIERRMARIQIEQVRRRDPDWKIGSYLRLRSEREALLLGPPPPAPPANR